MYKKISIFIIIICLIFIMSGCSKELIFDVNELKQEVKKVELLYYNSPTESDFIILIENEDFLDEFVDQFSKLKLTITFGAPGDLEGYCIKLFYNNFSYYLITKNHIEHYDENGKLLREARIYLDDIQFNELINKWKK